MGRKAKRRAPGPNAKHERFAVEYIKDRNGTQAAIRAGYSPRTAGQQASRLLKNAKIRARVDELQEEALRNAKVSAEEVLQIVRGVLVADLAQAVGPDGEVLKVTEMPRGLRLALSGLEVDELTAEGEAIGYTKKIHLNDRMRAAQLLMKHLGMLVDRVEITADESFAEILKRARARRGSR